MKRIRSGLIALMLWFVAGAAAAQGYPAKPVRVVVPFPPSGGTDVIARVVLPKLGDELGQQVVIDNRVGANGNVGTEIVARAAPDGYVLLLNGSGTLAVNPSLYSGLPYDSVRDFAPVSLAVFQPFVLVVHPSVPARSVREFIALARARPGQLNFASSGSGSLAHLAGEIFKNMARVDMVHVPYKGAGLSVIDLIAGQVQLIFAGTPSVMPYVKSGKLRALGVTTAKRAAATPEVPTIAESGLPGFDVTGWYGLLAPSGTPAPLVARLNAALIAVLKQPEVRDKLVGLGLDVEVSTPQQFADFIKSEIAKYAKVVRAAGVRVD